MCCASSPDNRAPPEPADRTAAGALAVFDLDGTVTRFDTLAPFLAGCLWRRPWRLPRLLAVLPAAARFVFDHDRGALKGALIRASLGGLPRSALQPDAQRFARWLVRHGLYRQALQALQAHRDRGDRLVLMSASTDLYVPQVGALLGFAEVICTRLRWRPDGRLDGRLASANCRGAEKRRQLSCLIERGRPRRVYAYGNSAADLPHMQLAQEAFLVNGPRGVEPGRSVQRVRWRG